MRTLPTCERAWVQEALFELALLCRLWFLVESAAGQLENMHPLLLFLLLLLLLLLNYYLRLEWCAFFAPLVVGLPMSGHPSFAVIATVVCSCVCDSDAVSWLRRVRFLCCPCCRFAGEWALSFRRECVCFPFSSGCVSDADS